MLDLRGKRQRNRALTPLEEVRVAAVRDHNVSEEVAGERDVCHRLLHWEIVQAQFEYANSFAAASHRREEASAAVLGDHLHGLSRQRHPVRRPEERYALRSLLPLQPQRARSTRVAQSNQRAPTEVGNQEADLPSTDRLRQRCREHIDRRDRRSGLDRCQESIQVKRRSPTPAHHS